ncbi:hypothetical protein CKO23_24590 [Thiocystis violacea]|nr:hypothetical protein [Thiocystis violacea]
MSRCRIRYVLKLSLQSLYRVDETALDFLGRIPGRIDQRDSPHERFMHNIQILGDDGRQASRLEPGETR